MTRKPATLMDVAREAGVSTATVSRVLSRPGGVSADKRAAVEAAVASTGYQLNHAARSLRRQQTGIAVALVPNISNPFFSRILDGIERRLHHAGLSLMVADTRSGTDARSLIRAFDNKSRADGIIVLDGALDWPAGANETPPAVYACEWRDGASQPRVRAENAKGAGRALGHLMDIGHRKIGFVGNGPNVLIQERLKGVRAEMKARGAALRPDWIVAGDFSLAAGAQAGDRWLAMADRPTGMICANDELAIGFIGAVLRAGARVPEDVSVIGFDDIDIARHVMPALTTVHQPRTELGEVAASTLIDLIAGRDVLFDRRLEVDLVVRQSTAPPRGT